MKKDVWVYTTYTEIQGNKVGANGLFGDMIFALKQKNSGIIDEASMEAWQIR
ncbi:hypothetical protein [Peribacillus frigoritolerans]|uniref:hypothetical protein n=1 Tax=Peribacillus frigoritolerans TaxID=450367 RepID=UPI00207A7AC6|nr:hypothetical protein [Peribacillus frigoritolerans]USK77106.1 hypothetical protein LIT31_11485 [Peribacillus frigoritolerans]